MMLDLFINHWTEPWEVGEKAFRMLSLQRHVNWEKVRVTLVHDGSKSFQPDLFYGLPFAVHQICLPHGGIAAARNWCIDHSDAEWIKWCDFDDCFAGIYGLWDLMHAMEIGQDYDLLWFRILFEFMDGRVFIKDQYDPVLVHSKAFRRSFLVEHGIRFPEHLTWCEDSAMLALTELEIGPGKKGEVKSLAPIYAYICRNGSLCNRPEIKFENRKSFFMRHCYVQDELEKHGRETQRRMMTVRVLGDSMYTMEQAGLKDDMTEHGARVWDYYMKHREDLTKVTSDQMQMVLDAVNAENDGCHITKAALLEWLRRMKSKYGGDVDVCRRHGEFQD